MDTQLIAVPYDSGYRGIRMGRGPLHFLANGAADLLKASVEIVEMADAFPIETVGTFELHRRVAPRVAAAVKAGCFPLLLSGTCSNTVAALAGTQADALIWFDAHGDSNTPETSSSGFLDGMSVMMAVGQCWRGVTRRIPDFTPLAPTNLLHLGGYDFDPGEREAMEHIGMTVVAADALRAGNPLTPALEELAKRAQRVYVHIDLDVLAISEGRANSYAGEDGLSLAQVEQALKDIRAHFQVCGATLSAYDPLVDADGRIARVGMRLMEMITQDVSNSNHPVNG